MAFHVAWEDTAGPLEAREQRRCVDLHRPFFPSLDTLFATGSGRLPKIVVRSTSDGLTFYPYIYFAHVTGGKFSRRERGGEWTKRKRRRNLAAKYLKAAYTRTISVETRDPSAAGLTLFEARVTRVRRRFQGVGIFARRRSLRVRSTIGDPRVYDRPRASQRTTTVPWSSIWAVARRRRVERLRRIRNAYLEAWEPCSNGFLSRHCHALSCVYK